MEVALKFIGTVSSPVKEGVDSNWGDIISEITINHEFAGGLKGLEDFSQAIIVYYMHKSSFEPETDLLRRPQGREDMPLVGIFSQRAKHRPNPIGITSVEIVEVQENSLKVRGLDAIDGTPVLDIKPYYPIYDMKEGATTPEWVDILMKDYF